MGYTPRRGRPVARHWNRWQRTPDKLREIFRILAWSTLLLSCLESLFCRDPPFLMLFHSFAGRCILSTMMKIALVAATCLLLASPALAQSQPQLNLMPMPSSVEAGMGQLAIDRSFSIAVAGFHDSSLDRGVRVFVDELSRQTGIP